MCGRFTLRASPRELVEMFELFREPELVPRYNIAPTQQVAAVRRGERGRELTLLHWGLVPSWSKDPRMGARMINARSETVAEKPSFRSAFRRRRCLIPANGFYEWKKLGSRAKQPVLITLEDDLPFAFAGLWEHWHGPDRTEMESCTIITTEANELLREVHDRMPVILPARDYNRWLDPRTDQREEIEPLLVPYPADAMKYHPVSTLVNNPRNEAPECIEPLESPGTFDEN